METMPKNVDGYPVVKELGRGVSGVVYQVKLPGRQKFAALKLFSGALSEGEILRFRREFGALTRCRHEGIVSVYGIGSLDKRPYILMEYVKGKPFDQALRHGLIDRQPFPIDRQNMLVRLVYLVLDTLNYLHRRKIIHRDIKPANIIVTGDSSIKVLDFGLAWNSMQTGESMPAGTAGYQAPEQILQHTPDPGWDLYSLGVTLYQIIAGIHPFADCNSWQTLLEKQLESDVKPLKTMNPEMAEKWTYFIARLMAPEPSNRFYSAGQAIAELKRIAPDDVQTSQYSECNENPPDLLNPQWIDTGSVLEKTTQAITKKKHVSYLAPSGAGRTRYLRETSLLLKKQRFKTLFTDAQKLNTDAWLKAVVKNIFKDSLDKNETDNKDVRTLKMFIENRLTLEKRSRLHESVIRALGRIVKTINIDSHLVILIDNGELCSSDMVDTVNMLKLNKKIHFVITAGSLPEGLMNDVVVLEWTAMSAVEVQQLMSSLLACEKNISIKIAEKLANMAEGKAGLIVQFFKIWLRSGLLKNDCGEWYLYPPAALEPISLSKDNSAEKMVARPDIRRSLPETDRIDREILRILSAVPESCNFDILSKVFAAKDTLLLEVLDRLIRSGWLIESVKNGHTVYHFENLKDKTGVYNAIAPFHKRYIHKRILETLQKIDPRNIGEQAFHVHRSESPVTEVELLARAANYASDHFDNESAVVYYDQIHDIVSKNLGNRGYIYPGPEDWIFRLGEDINTMFHESMLQSRAAFFEDLKKTSLEVWQNKGNLYGRTGNYGAAFDSFQHMLAGAQDIHNKKYESDALRLIGQILYYQRKLDESKKYFEQSLKIRKKIKDTAGIADCLNALGVIAQQMNNNKQAESLFLESLKIKTILNDERGMAYIRNNLANLYHSQNDYEKALKEFRIAADVSRKLNDELGLAYTLYNIGGVCIEIEKYKDAVSALEESLQIRRKMQDLQDMGHCMWQLAIAQNAMGNKKQAVKYLREACEVLEDVGLSDDVAECEKTLEEILQQTKN